MDMNKLMTEVLEACPQYQVIYTNGEWQLVTLEGKTVYTSTYGECLRRCNELEEQRCRLISRLF